MQEVLLGFILSVAGYPLGVWSAYQALDEVKRYQKQLPLLRSIMLIVIGASLIMREFFAVSVSLFIFFFLCGVINHKEGKAYFAKFTK